MEQSESSKKVFVLDTNVYLNDPNAIFNFEEHDIYVPIVVLRELNHSKSNEKKPEVARNARLTSRYFFELKRGAKTTDVEKGFPLSRLSTHYKRKDLTERTSRVFFERITPESLAIPSFPDGAIINYTSELQKTLGENVEVVLVTQDILADLISLSAGVQTEEYKSGKAIDDIDLLYSGIFQLPDNFWDVTITTVTESGKEGKFSWWKIITPLAEKWYPGQFLYIQNEEKTDAREEYIVQEIDGQNVKISTITDYRKGKNNIWGLYAKNFEQNCYMNALMDEEKPLVTGAGEGGTGKTVLALAAALEQTARDKPTYRKILLTKEAMPIGKELGFFPGSEEEKMAPWMGAFNDNLDFLTTFESNARVTKKLLMERYIEVTSIGTMQGRTFHKKFVIIDETENLPPETMKKLISRAGLGTKVVCIGNVAQIATQYLTAEACGLTHVVEAAKTWPHSAHVTLIDVERGLLAEFADKTL